MNRQECGSIRIGQRARVILGDIATRLERVLEEDAVLHEEIFNTYRGAVTKMGYLNLAAASCEKLGTLMGIIAIQSGQETMRYILTGQKACLEVPESAAVFLDACIAMHPAVYKQLYRFICEHCAYIESPPDTVTRRAKMMINMRIQATSRGRILEKNLPSSHAICRLHNRKKLDLEEVPPLAKVLDISPHWLWMLDEKAGIYSNDGRVDCLVDAFLLLDTDMRKRVVQVACAMAETGGK